jgi:UDP:flavonoid glycosyltransferase YjiC (YdhE family)
MAAMRMLFLSAQMPGHIDWGGLLLTAAELARRGHDVLWASGAEVERFVVDAGVGFHRLETTGWRWPPPPPLPRDEGLRPDELHMLKQQRALDQWLDVDRVAVATEEISKLVRAYKPDLMISEMFVAAAGLAAELHDVPLAIAGWPAPNPQASGQNDSSKRMQMAPDVTQPDTMVTLARVRLQGLFDRFAVSGSNWTAFGPPALLSPILHLTFWSPSWFGGIAQPPTRHVGGVAPLGKPTPPTDLPSPEACPWVLITLGTSFNRDPNFFINAAHAAHRMGCLPLVVFGADLEADWVQEATDRLPKTAVVRKRLDFASTLPFVRVAIHHGGAGTTHALVVQGIPQLVIPHAADQHRQANGVARTGVGISISPQNASIDAIVASLSVLLPDLSVYRRQAGELQSEFRSLGGVPAAADLLESIPTTIPRLSALPFDPPRRTPTEDNRCKP